MARARRRPLTRPEIMSRIRGKNTGPELRLRKALRTAGIGGYRLHWGRFRIDVAWPGRRVAVFVDGCFWHGCPQCYREPRTNREYWLPKIRANRRRDRRASGMLRRAGWKVIRIQEHKIRRDVPDSVLRKIRKALSVSISLSLLYLNLYYYLYLY